eukprot:scpid40369/ scgid31358/ 
MTSLKHSRNGRTIQQKSETRIASSIVDQQHRRSTDTHRYVQGCLQLAAMLQQVINLSIYPFASQQIADVGNSNVHRLIVICEQDNPSVAPQYCSCKPQFAS